MGKGTVLKRILTVAVMLVITMSLCSMAFMLAGCSEKNDGLCEHSYSTNVIAPTCTAGGYTEHTCTLCSFSYKDKYTDALGHSGGEAHNGYSVCEKCGAPYSSVADESVDIVPNEPCGHELNKYGYCGVCQVDMSYVTVAIGKDITLEYHIKVHDPDLINDKTLQVVINDGDHVEIISDLVSEDDGFIFKYHGIAPHQMAHEVDAALVVVDDGKLTVIDDILKYSVKQNIRELLNDHKDEPEIVQILSDILRYGAASQVYMKYELDDLATDGVEGLLPERTDVPEKSDQKIVTAEGVESNTYFNGATVLFDSTTKLKITIATEDISKVTVSINGGEQISGDAFIAGANEGQYYFYTEDIGMAHYGDVYTFTVYDNGVEVETLTYSVNSYAYSKKDSENESMKALALALYRAGLSAAEWIANHQG